jgi:hypothetical protein
MHTYDVRQWAFTLSDEPDAWAKGYDDTSWRAVTVPHDWSVEQEFAQSLSSGTGYLPGGIGWYRAHVSLAAVGELAGKHVRLTFHGVYKNAQVWVNGYHVGARPNGWAEFSFDLTEILSYAHGDDLVISVRVEHTDISDSRWFNGSGITRRVELVVEELVRVREHGIAFTTLSADVNSAKVRIETALTNDTDSATAVHVQHELKSLTSGRTQTFTTDANILSGGSADTVVSADVPQPELWSDTTPHLYRLTTTLTWGSGKSAVYDDIVGIRTFRFDPDHGFTINGAPRKLKGVCLHEDAGPFGVAVPAAVWLRRLLKLKDMGCNGVRMSHNPHSPELYRLCDALGFFVIDEAFDEWENAKNKWWQGHNVYPPRHQGYAKDFHAWHERDLEAMIDAHRNHASIIMWSIGNEIDYPNDPYVHEMFPEMTGNNDARKTARQRSYDPNKPDARRLPTIARRLIDIVKRKDTTRPVTLGAAYPELSSRTGLTALFDVIGYNYKEHLYEEDHQRFPQLPILGSENGHSYENWRHVADKDYISGQFLWTGIDYLGEAHGWPIHGSGAGLLNVAGNDKHTFHLRRSWWSDEPVAYIVTRPHDTTKENNFWSQPIARRWDGAGEGDIEILCFSNGEPKLTCGGEEIPLTRDDANGYWVAVAAPRSAPLVLETRRDGQVVARDELGPRGDAVQIDAAVWKASAAAVRLCTDAGLSIDTVSQVECTLRDANGAVAGNDLEVTAEVTGGNLLGLENGDLADNTAYTAPYRRTLDGRVVVFVQADGSAKLRLSALGLPDVEVECGA